jgi:hypothetical protein
MPRGRGSTKKSLASPVLHEVHVGAIDSDAVAVERVVAHPGGVREVVVLGAGLHADDLADLVEELMRRYMIQPLVEL